MARFGHSLPKEKLGGIGLPSWLPDWLTGKDVREIQGPVYIPPRGKAGGYRKELAADIARQARDPFTQRDIYSAVQAGADFVPLMGEDVGVREAAEDWQKGDRISAIAGGLGTALGVVPVVGDVSGKLVKEGGKKLAKGLGASTSATIAEEGAKGLGRTYPLAKDWYGDMNYQQTGGRMVEMTPDDYLAQTRPMKIDELTQENVNDLKRHIEEGGELDPVALYGSGKEDGRHRALAAKALGIEKIPVLTWRPDAPKVKKTASAVVDPVAPKVLGGIKAYHGTPEKGLVNLEPRQPALGMKAIYASTSPEHAGPFAKKGMAEGGQVIPLEVSGNIAPRKYVTDLYDQGLNTDQIYERLRQEGYAGFYEDPVHEGMGIFDASSVGYPDRPAQGLGGIRAYHGSPHSFEEFDISKIGTGEGAQAYGHGLYFAENEGVAQSYADTLTKNAPWDNKTAIEIDNSTLGDGRVMVNGYTKYNPPGGGGTRRESFSIKGVEDEYQSVDEALADLKAKGKIPENATTWTDPDSGHLHISTVPPRMYEVNIAADPEAFLDWDKPLSEQSPTVREQLGGLGSAQKNRPLAATDVGRELYYKQTQGLTSTGATERLKEAGIPGIRYLDQGSRVTSGGELLGVEKTPQGWQAKIKVTNRQGVGIAGGPTDMFTTSKPYTTEAEARKWAEDKISSGSRNYVVFDPKLISIVKKYGLAAAISAGLISEEMGRQMQEQGEL